MKVTQEITRVRVGSLEQPSNPAIMSTFQSGAVLVSVFPTGAHKKMELLHKFGVKHEENVIMDREGKILPFKSLETYLKEHQFFHLESQIDSQVKACQDALVMKYGYTTHKTVVDSKLAKFFIKHFAFTCKETNQRRCFGNSRCYESETAEPDNLKMDRRQVMKYFRLTFKMKTQYTFIVNGDNSEILNEPVGKELTLISDDDFFLKYFFKYFKGEPFASSGSWDGEQFNREYKYKIRNKVETSVRDRKLSLTSDWLSYSKKYIQQCKIYCNVFKPKLNDIDDEEKEEEWNTLLENKVTAEVASCLNYEKQIEYIKKNLKVEEKILQYNLEQVSGY